MGVCQMKEGFQSFADQFYRFLTSVGYEHPIHPILVDMPIGLATGALLFGIVAFLSRRSTLRLSTRHCLVLALLFLFPTVLAGYMDWQHFYGGVWLYPIRIKIWLGLGLFVLLLIGIFVSRRPQTSTGHLIVYILAFLVVGALGYFGGEIVFGGRAPETQKDHNTGEILFRGRCSGCHPYGGNILMPQDPIINSSLLRTNESFKGWIRNPTTPMPSFPPESISDEQVRDLYGYITEFWGRESPGQEEQKPQSGSPSTVGGG